MPYTEDASAALQRQFPRLPREDGMAYARRLSRSAERRPSVQTLARITDASLAALRRDLTTNPLSAELQRVRDDAPPRVRERPVEYAARLHLAYPRLNNYELSRIAEAQPMSIDRDPRFYPPLAGRLADIRDAHPRLEHETAFAYADRLRNEVQDPLTTTDIAHIARVNLATLKQHAGFRPPLTERLAAIKRRVPQEANEPMAAYARRLSASPERLARKDVARITEMDTGNLSRALKAPQASSDADLDFAAELERQLATPTSAPSPPDAPTQQPPVLRSLIPAQTIDEPRLDPLEHLLAVQPWLVAGVLAMMRRDHLPLARAEQLANLPADTLGLIAGQDGRLHSASQQRLLLQQAGANAPELRSLLEELKTQDAQAPLSSSGGVASGSASQPPRQRLPGDLPPAVPSSPDFDFAAELERQLASPARSPTPSVPSSPDFDFAMELERQLDEERGGGQPGPASTGADSRSTPRPPDL